MDFWYSLINHGVSRNEIGKTPTGFLFDMYKQKCSQTNEWKNTLDHGKKESQPMNQFPDLSQFADAKPLRDSPTSSEGGSW